MSDLHVLSLGAGTQSSAMALMSVYGDLPRPDYVIFSDTGWEPKVVYDWLDDLKNELQKHDLEVITVSNGNIYDDTLKSSETGARSPSLPYFTKSSTGKKGMVMRQCTNDYKIMPIQRKVRELLGYKPRQRVREQVYMWQGITVDEVTRIRQSQTGWITFKYPLFEKGMDRLDAINYVRDKMGEIPPQSSCIGCPFHSDDLWLDIKQNHPDDWQQAVEFDRRIRNHPKFNDKLYLHRSCKPLSDIDFNENQMRLDDFIDGFENECYGMCGV